MGASTTSGVSYIQIPVQKGDSYWKYSREYGVSIKDIEEANPDKKATRLQIGSTVTIPILNSSSVETVSAPEKTLKTEQKEVEEVSGTDTQKLTTLSPEKIKEKKFLNTINEHLNIPNYTTHIEEKEGAKYLVLSRPNDDPYNYENRHNINLTAIKSNLFIKDGVLQNVKYNDLDNITGKSFSRIFDDATIDPGKSLYIPVEAIGQKFSLFGSNKELKQAVEEFNN